MKFISLIAHEKKLLDNFEFFYLEFHKESPNTFPLDLDLKDFRWFREVWWREGWLYDSEAINKAQDYWDRKNNLAEK